MFNYPPLTGVSINTIQLNPPITNLLWVIFFCSLIIFSIYSKIKIHKIKYFKVLLFSLSLSSLVYFVFNEGLFINWVFSDYQKLFFVENDHQAVRNNEGDIVLIADEIKKTIDHQFYFLAFDQSYLEQKLNYFLLPARAVSDVLRAQYVIAIQSQKTRLDLVNKKVFYNEIELENLELVQILNDQIALFKVNSK